MTRPTWLYGKPIDVALIRAFEAEFGRGLPESYVAIAALHDSGIPTPDGIAYADPDRACGWNQVGIGELLSYVDGIDGMSAIRWMNHRFAQVTGDFVVFSDWNGYYFALDYGVRERDPPVVLFTHDRTLSGKYCIPVAHSFDDLLARVRESECEETPADLIPFTPGPGRIGKGRFE